MQEIEFEEVKKVIESCHLNFLIGSGASMPFLQTLNQIETLLTEIESLKNADVDKKKLSLLEASIKQDYFTKSIENNLVLIQNVKNSNPNEIRTTTIQNYRIFLESIQTILVNRRSNLVNKQVNIFTTNMDILIEHTLENINAVYNDGFNGRLSPMYSTENFHNSIRKTSTHYDYESEIPLFNIFKLHGSVNWKLNVNTISYDYGLTTLKSVQEKSKLMNDNLIDINTYNEYKNIKDLYNEITDANESQKQSCDEFLKCYNDLVIINPTKGKFETTTIDLTFYELLRMYSNHLEKTNSVLFVIGFSFSDEHIREITKRVAKSNPTLLIVVFAYNKQSKNDILNNLHELPNIKYIWDETDEINYSIDKINSLYFQKIANHLQKIPTEKRELNNDKFDKLIEVLIKGQSNESK